MVLVPIGESAVSISINGTERINEIINDDTTYNLSESFNTNIRVNGQSQGNFTQSQNSSYNINVSAEIPSPNWTTLVSDSIGQYPPNDYHKVDLGTISERRIVRGTINNRGANDGRTETFQYNTGNGWVNWFNNKYDPAYKNRTGVFPAGTSFRIDDDRYEYGVGGKTEYVTNTTPVNVNGTEVLTFLPEISINGVGVS